MLSLTDDMASLIKTCGGEIVPSIELMRQGEKTPLIVTCSDVEDDGGDVLLSSQDIVRFNSKLEIKYLRGMDCLSRRQLFVRVELKLPGSFGCPSDC